MIFRRLALESTASGRFARTNLLAILSLGLLALSLNGCSSEAMYQSIQQNGLRASKEFPIAQQASYKAQYQKDYATYKRERDFLKAS